VGLYAEIDAIRALNERGDYERSLQKITELPHDNSELYYFGQVWMIYNYINLGKISDADRIMNDVLVPIELVIEKKLSLTLRIAIIAIKMRVLANLGDYKQMEPLLISGKALIDDEFVTRIINFTEKHLEEISTHKDLIYWIIRFNWHSTSYYDFKGGRKISIELYKKNLKLANLIDDQIGKFVSLLNTGITYRNIGKLELSLKYLLDAMVVNKAGGKQGLNTVSSVHLNCGIALTYQMRGELDLALKYAIEGYEQANKSSYLYLRNIALYGLGTIYYQMGNYELAIKHYEKVLNNPVNFIHHANIMTYLGLIYIELGDQEKIYFYFSKIEQISKESGSRVDDQLYRLMKALILKQKRRTLSRAKAQELFQEIIDEGSLPEAFHTSIIAILNLCELLLDELAIYQEEDILIETHELIYNLRKYTQENYLYPDLINALILQSRLCLVQGDITKAVKMLVQADLITEEKKLDRCKKSVEKEKDLQNKEMNRWKTLSDKSSAFRERLEMANLREYIIKMKSVKHVMDSKISSE
jgi:tetratricopeptide (TPR) repeat protein